MEQLWTTVIAVIAGRIVLGVAPLIALAVSQRVCGYRHYLRPPGIRSRLPNGVRIRLVGVRRLAGIHDASTWVLRQTSKSETIRRRCGRSILRKRSVP